MGNFLGTTFRHLPMHTFIGNRHVSVLINVK